MKNRKKLLLGFVLLVVGVGSVATWAITRANTKPQPINTRYLEAFFLRYVSSLNSNDIDHMISFYAPDAVSTMAWGNEMNNQQRAAYYAECKQAFPQAVFEIKKVTYEPTSETSGYITWDFGIKSGPQMAPFMGVYKKVEKEPGKIYDQEGVSTGQVAAINSAALGQIKQMERQIASLDEEILSLDQQIAALNERISSEKGPSHAVYAEGGSSSAAERFALAEKRAGLAERRAELDRQLIDTAVGAIKFTRQSSFQNMDAFLKKIGGN